MQFTVVFPCVCLTFPEIQPVVIGVVPERAIWNDKQVVSFQNNRSDALASTLLVFHKLPFLLSFKLLTRFQALVIITFRSNL